jgi:hypothetical protein
MAALPLARLQAVTYFAGYSRAKDDGVVATNEQHSHLDGFWRGACVARGAPAERTPMNRRA